MKNKLQKNIKLIKIEDFDISQKYDDEQVFLFGKAKAINKKLTNFNIGNKFIIMKYKDIIEHINKHPEITDKQIHNLKYILYNPKIVLNSKNTSNIKNNNSKKIVVFDDRTAENSLQQLLILECNPYNYSNAVVITSTYTKNNSNNATNSFIQQSDIEYIDNDIKIKSLASWLDNNNIDDPSINKCITDNAKSTIEMLQDYRKLPDLSLYLYRNEDDKEPEIRNLYNLKADNTIYTIDKFVKFEVRDSKNIESSTRLPEYEKKYSSLIKDTIDKANKYVDIENAKFDGKTEEAIDKINEHSASKEALQSISESLEIKNKINSKKFTK